MKTRLIALFSLLFVFGVFIMSCDETDLLPDPDETSTTSAEDNAAAELAVTSVFEGVNSFGIDEDGKKNATLDDPTVTWDGTTCTLVYPDGGTIVCEFSTEDPNYDALFTASISVTDFTASGYLMNGAFDLSLTQIMGVDEGPAFSISIQDDLTFVQDTVTMTWSGERNIVWVEGYTPPIDLENAVFNISGNSSGINSEGVPYTVVISEENPLVLDDCEYIPQGEITITETPEGEEESEMILDFGDGTCDNLMTVTVGGVSVEVEL